MAESPAHAEVLNGVENEGGDSTKVQSNPPPLDIVQAQSVHAEAAEDLDSRTSIGRPKRGLEPSSPHDSDAAEDDERAKKRQRHDSTSIQTEATVPGGIAPQSRGVSSSEVGNNAIAAEVPSGASLREEREHFQASDAKPHSHFDVVAVEAEALSDFARTPVPRTWNAGVQSGLRTSFASKKQALALPTTTSASILPASQVPADGDENRDINLDEDPKDLDVDNDDVDEDVGSVKDSNIADSTRLPDPTDVAAPFKKIEKSRLKMLSKQERDRYREAKRAHKKTRAEKNSENGTASKVETGTDPSPDKKSRKELEREENTAAADSIINQTTPLSEEQQKIITLMDSGLTYYARIPHVPKPMYKNKHGKWILNEIFDAQGRPVKLQDFGFGLFAPAFMYHNSQNWEPLTPKMLVAAYGCYISAFYSHLTGLTEPLRTAVSARTAPTMKKLMDLASKTCAPPASIFAHRLPSNNAAVRHAAEAVADGINDSPMDVVSIDAGLADSGLFDVASVDSEVRKAELMLLQRYFPSNTNAVERCLTCGRKGHHFASCQSMTCTVCRTTGLHSSSMCPELKRCGKCRERGHPTAECVEKLSLPKSELACDICGASEHIELACHLVWRSYDPSLEEICKVRDIPVNCYSCGGGDHFGPECGLHRGVIFSGGHTWSKDNLLKYIDHSSTARALSAGKDYTVPSRPGNKHMGMTGNSDYPIALDDESEEEGFIRPKVQSSNANPGKIHVKRSSRAKHTLQQEEPVRQGRQGRNQKPLKAQFQPVATRPVFADPNSAPPRNAPRYGGPSNQYANSPQWHSAPPPSILLPMRGGLSTSSYNNIPGQTSNRGGPNSSTHKNDSGGNSNRGGANHPARKSVRLAKATRRENHGKQAANRNDGGSQ